MLPDGWLEHEAPDGEESSASMTFDPLADLLLGLIAIAVPLIGILLAAGAAMLPENEAPQAQIEDSSTAPLPPLIISASADGVSISDGEKLQIVARDRILDDAAFAMLLEQSRDSGKPILLRIEPDGLESAFLFDSVAARHGPAMIRQIRLTLSEQPSPRERP